MRNMKESQELTKRQHDAGEIETRLGALVFVYPLLLLLLFLIDASVALRGKADDSGLG